MLVEITRASNYLQNCKTEKTVKKGENISRHANNKEIYQNVNIYPTCVIYWKYTKK